MLLHNFVISMKNKPSLYEQFLVELDEIMKHKWIESEKQGYDIGFEKALTSWVKNHRNEWLAEYNRLKNNTPDSLR